jgi:hypothetical protein
MNYAYQCRALTTLLLLCSPMVNTALMAKSLDGINSARTCPVIDGIGPIDSPDAGSDSKYSGAVFFDYASNPATATQTSSGETIELVPESQRSVALLQYNPISRLSLEVAVPYWFQADTDRKKAAFSTDNSQQGNLGDIALSSRIRILSTSLITAAILPFAVFPTGNPENLTGDGVNAYGSNFSVGSRRNRWFWAVQGGFIYRPEEAVMTDDRLDPVSLGSQYTGGLAVGYKIRTSSSVEVGLIGALPEDDSPKYDMVRFAESSLKIKQALKSGLAIDAQGAVGLGYGIGVPEFRLSIGLIWQPGKTSERTVAHDRRRNSLQPRANNWYEARPQDFAADRDVRKRANKVKSYDTEGEKNKSFGFYSQ